MSSLMDGLDDEEEQPEVTSQSDAKVMSDTKTTSQGDAKVMSDTKTTSQGDAQVIPKTPPPKAPKNRSGGTGPKAPKGDADATKKITLLEGRISDLKEMISDLHKKFADHIQHTQILSIPTPAPQIHEITDELINEFLTFLQNADPNKYPTQGQLINQVKKYGKRQIIANIFQLFKIFEASRK